jgi:hypothetical protein
MTRRRCGDTTCVRGQKKSAGRAQPAPGFRGKPGDSGPMSMRDPAAFRQPSGAKCAVPDRIPRQTPAPGRVLRYFSACRGPGPNAERRAPRFAACGDARTAVRFLVRLTFRPAFESTPCRRPQPASGVRGHSRSSRRPGFARSASGRFTRRPRRRGITRGRSTSTRRRSTTSRPRSRRRETRPGSTSPGPNPPP